MTIEHLILGILVALTLSMSLLIETSSWTVRVYVKAGSLGTYISRTNIYLYGGRFFAILTQVVMGFLVDNGTNSLAVLQVFIWSFIVASITHSIILGRSNVRNSLDLFLLRLMGLDRPATFNFAKCPKDRKLYFATTATTTFFSVALIVPLVLASAFPSYRLTLNNAGSLINFLGMIVLLGYLDPLLYRALDEGSISQKIESYVWGRVTGFILCALMLFVVLLAS